MFRNMLENLLKFEFIASELVVASDEQDKTPFPNFRTSKHRIAASKESTIQPYGSKWTCWAGKN